MFTPSILTILGVIMYLRFGWVVANAGLAGTLIIVTIATGITLLTGLSISQIATDQRIKTGGAYYMIGRALGIEVGGAIGIPLYIAQALSVSLYTIGGYLRSGKCRISRGTLSHLLATSLEWRGATVTVRMIVVNPGGAEEARQYLSALIKSARIDAEVEIMVDPRPAPEVISSTSRTADIAFLGLPSPDPADVAGFADILDALILQTESIPAVAFILASKSADLDLILQ